MIDTAANYQRCDRVAILPFKEARYDQLCQTGGRRRTNMIMIVLIKEQQQHEDNPHDPPRFFFLLTITRLRLTYARNNHIHTPRFGMVEDALSNDSFMQRRR
mmetsp:Transcript_6860/g.20116  ORF Transcript_6860/g.20116 Transcript_6860/m.20116 type:complete len:102 (-) Transcript_6860:310-615(-)